MLVQNGFFLTNISSKKSGILIDSCNIVIFFFFPFVVEKINKNYGSKFRNI